MCVRDIDYTSISTIFPLDFGNVPTVYHFLFTILFQRFIVL